MLVCGIGMPQTATAQIPLVIAEKLAELPTNLGAASLDTTTAEGVRILDSGEVLSIRRTAEGRLELQRLAILTENSIAALSTSLDQLAEVELVDLDPDAPRCPEATQVSYRGRLAEGRLSLLAVSSSCHTYVHPEPSAVSAIALLDGFDQLRTVRAQDVQRE